MGGKSKPRPEQIPFDQLPIRECCSCGAWAYQVKHPLQDLPELKNQPVINSISVQIYRRTSKATLQIASPSFRICDSCLQKALVQPILFESAEGSALLKALRNSLITRYKAMLEEQGE